jgi:hypothetical protein
MEMPTNYSPEFKVNPDKIFLAHNICKAMIIPQIKATL